MLLEEDTLFGWRKSRVGVGGIFKKTAKMVGRRAGKNKSTSSVPR